MTQNPIPVPYQRQRDDTDGDGWRNCFSSAVAMAAMYWGAIENDDAYRRVRRRHGDTTNPMAHVQALLSLGLRARFTNRLRWEELVAEIEAGRPTPVGWLHRGPVTAPRGGGHWSTVIGTTQTGLIVHDPYGDPDLIGGGWIPGRSGQSLHFSRRNFSPRWQPEGPGNGWAVLISPPRP